MKVFSKFIILFMYLCFGFFFLFLPKIHDLFFSKENVLNVYTYADFISSKSIKSFEEKTGIKVNLKYFDNDYELLAKFEIDKGVGYDLITATGFVVNNLIKKGLLQNVDVTQIPNFSEVDSYLLNKPFDLDNKFTVPYFWSVRGIIFNKNALKTPINKISWDLVFGYPGLQLKSGYEKKVLMINTPLELIQIAAIYLFGSLKDLNSKSLDKIANLLIQQKNWVDVYMTGSLQYYLLSRIVDVAVTYTAFAKKMMEVSDQYKFVIPHEGSIITIDSFAIPKSSNKKRLAQKLIDFLISKENSVLNSKEYGYNPSNKYAYEEIKRDYSNDEFLCPDREMLKKLHLQGSDLKPKNIENLWLKVRLF